MTLEAGTLLDGSPSNRRTDPLGDTSSSVGKALSLLNAFIGANNEVLGVSEIARRAGVAKSTAHRLLAVLEGHGLVERAGDGWLLGAHLFRLGNTVAMCRPHRLRDRALPYMQALHIATQAMVNLGVLHGPQVLYIEKLAARGGLESPARVGGCMPIYCTAIGKAMLAFSPDDLFDSVVAAGMPGRTTQTITSPDVLRQELVQIRRTGFAIDRQESKVGMACVAAPILRDGRPVAGLSVSVDIRRGLPQQFVPRLLRTAGLIAARLQVGEDDLR
ncbi:IclR family transcriptional regulator [Blastococcus sp. SYSU D00669]